MEKKIINEVNRVREIMGLPLISEAPATTVPFLDDLLENARNLILGGTSFRPTGQISTELTDLIKKTVKTSFSSYSDNQIDNIVQRIARGEKNIPGMDYATLAKNLVKYSDEMIDVFDNYVENSVPALAKQTEKINDYVKKLPRLLARNPELYDEAVNEIIKIRNSILDLNIDETLKTTFLNRYGLMDVMTRKAQQETVKRQNIVVDGLNKIYKSLKPQGISATDYRYVGSGLNLTQKEYDLLKKVALGEENWFTTTTIPGPLRKELISALEERGEGGASFVDEYYKGILLKLGYIKNLENEVELKYGSLKFLRDVYNMSEKLGIDVRQTLKNFIENEDEIGLVASSIESQVKTFGPLFSKAIGTEAVKNNAVNVFLKSGAFGRFLNLVKLKVNRPVEFFKVIREMTGGKSVAEEATESIDNQLKIIAANNLEEIYTDTTPQWQEVFNQLARINKGLVDMNAKTREIFEKILQEDSAFRKDPALVQMLLNDPEIEELIKSVALTGNERAVKAITTRIMAYLKVIPTVGLWEKVYEGGWKNLKVKDVMVDLPKKWMSRIVRTGLLADPLSQSEFRKFMSYAGTKGIWLDKFAHLVLISGLIVPFIEAYKEDAELETIRSRELEKWTLIQERFCKEDLQITSELDPDFCNKVNKLVSDLTPEAASLSQLFKKNIPILGDVGFEKIVWNSLEGITGLDEIVSFLKPVDKKLRGEGADAALEEIKNLDLLGIQQTVSSELQQMGWDNTKTPEQNLQKIGDILTHKGNLRKQIGPSDIGFLAFCQLKGYEMVDYADGFGTAKVDGTNKEFEYKRLGNTFKETN